jgi:hypothetical protein
MAFAGFDTAYYPGDACLDWLKANTNLVWCGYYLAPAPSHPDKSWMGKRARLAAAGWGILPVYVGQQIEGPGSQIVTPEQGAMDGQDAVGLMTQDGFAPGSVVILDMEGGTLTQPFNDYATAWVQAVQNGGFTAGIYCSHLYAAQVAKISPGMPVWAVKVPTVAVHPVAGPPYPSPAPAGSGYAQAAVWQLDDNAQIAVPVVHGGKLLVDLSSAIAADPGAPVKL